jgi:hypothetical protein
MMISQAAALPVQVLILSENEIRPCTDIPPHCVKTSRTSYVFLIIVKTRLIAGAGY